MSANHQITRTFHASGRSVTTIEIVEGFATIDIPEVEIPARAVDYEVPVPALAVADLASLYIGWGPMKPRGGGEAPLTALTVKVNRAATGLHDTTLTLPPGAPYIWTVNDDGPCLRCETITALYVTNPSGEPVKLNVAPLLKRPEPKAVSSKQKAEGSRQKTELAPKS